MATELSFKKCFSLKISERSLFDLFHPQMVKEEILPFCIDLKIEPLDLCIKLLEDFAKADVSENVQTLRYNAYEAKRQCKISTYFPFITYSFSKNRAIKRSYKGRQ